MRVDRLGSTCLASLAGVVADVPYAILEQGLVLASPTSPATVAILPIAAAEDPRFGPYTTRNGIYRVEDASARVARIGQGRILDRVRRHRASRVVMPSRLICAVPRQGEWSFSERCYLETQWAYYWRTLGHALASGTFVTAFPGLSASRRAALDTVIAGINELVAAGSRLLAGNLNREFWPVEPKRPMGAQSGSSMPVGYHRTYPVGTRLLYETNRLLAKALVQVDGVILLPESLVHLSVGTSIGTVFRRQHAIFLSDAGTIAMAQDLGRTTRAVSQPTAAAMIKRISGGRVHNADRWQPYPPTRSL